MSWQLGAFSILALALSAGFAWYERARPDARVVALVATLAAFAALGRIAFAALPNIKPTTDIVLISGYALGAGPGFVVGALAGLTSNFFFGQGPWTPWQMAAWGACGLLGAGLAILLARLRRDHGRATLSRWPLGVLCAVVGFGFAAFQDFGDWVNYSDHSAAQLGIYVGKGIGFDFVHAAACLAFAIAFGPALGRSLGRLRVRLEVTWRPAGVLALLVALLLLAQAASLAGATPAQAATPDGYLLSAQNGDGGFGASPGAPSSPLYSGWSALGLAASGHDLSAVRAGGASVLDYVRAGSGSLNDTGALERTILVVAAAGRSPRSFAGQDLVSALQHQVRGDGSVGDQVNLTAFAVLALDAGGAPPATQTLSWLAAQQDGDGGFGFATGGGGSSDVDDSGAALEALAGSGAAGMAAAPRAVRFIRAQQNPDGGFPARPGGESNAQSTAWAVQGLIAAGVDPNTLHRAGALSPLAFLRSLTDVDGHVHYSRSSDQTPVWVTAEAAIALAGKPLPLAPPAGVGGPQRASSTTAGLAGASAGRAGGARARSARARRSGRRAGASSRLLGLAAEAGIATALLLAPVGL